MEIAISILGVLIGLGGWVYAYYANRVKASRDNLVRAGLARLAGNIAYVHSNPVWADSHFAQVRELALQLEMTDEVKEILRHTHDGARDSCVGDRAMRVLLNQVMSLQEGLFSAVEMSHPDIQSELDSGDS